MKTKSILWACLTCLSFFAFAACSGNADDLDAVLLKANANADLPREENGVTLQPLHVAGDYVVMECIVSDEAPQEAHLLCSAETCNEVNQFFEMAVQQVQSDPDINAAVIEEIQNSVRSMMIEDVMGRDFICALAAKNMGMKMIFKSTTTGQTGEFILPKSIFSLLRSAYDE